MAKLLVIIFLTNTEKEGYFLGKSSKKKVLIAMTGRRDSTVAAYLLKKQGFECIGIAFLFSDEKVLQKQVDLTSKKRPGLDDNEGQTEETMRGEIIPQEKLYGRCHISDIDAIAKICEKLGISFFGVKGKDNFNSSVRDPLIASALGGTSFNSCVNCNNIKLSLLAQKADELGCSYIATGHYAKISKNQKTGHFSIYTANDLENDQSYLLSRLPQETLKKLILPLAEMRFKEVLKVKEMIGLELLESSRSNRPCFTGDLRFPYLVEACAASSLLKPGQVFLQEENMIARDHQGIHYFQIGQKKIKLPDDKVTKSKLIISDLVPNTGSVVLSPEKDFSYSHLSLSSVILDINLNLSKPLVGLAKLAVDGDLWPCKIYFKNFMSIVIQFLDIQKGIVPTGTNLVIYNKKGTSGKIFLSGFVMKSGIIQNGKLLNYIRPIKRQEEGDDQNDTGPDLPEFTH